MAGIKNINVISGTGNPVQMQDLQNLWSAINSLLRSTKTPISIVAGFATANNDTGTNIGEGIICYQGQAYYLAADVAKIGQYLYANTIQDEQRVYEDGATRYTYQDYVVNAAANASASGIGTLIGQATAANLAAWKVGVLSDGSVTAAMLADGAVTTPKLANSAVTTAKIADGAVGSLQIGLEAIKNGNIQDGQITGSKMADQSIPGSKLSNKTITGTQIADKAITAEKIADGAVGYAQIAYGAVTAGKIEAETITNEEIANKTIIASQKLENGSIEEAQYGTASVSTRALQANSVNTSNIKDGAVTGSKIADDAISGEKIEKGTIPADKMAAPGVIYLEPTTVTPNAILVNHKLNIIKIGNVENTHINAIMPVQQLPGTPVRIFIEHTFAELHYIDIKLSQEGVVKGNINIASNVIGMYVEIFVYNGGVYYWISGDGNYTK
nr:MAG: hypothetical protein [Bacteriophage sp.]